LASSWPHWRRGLWSGWGREWGVEGNSQATSTVFGAILRPIVDGRRCRSRRVVRRRARAALAAIGRSGFEPAAPPIRGRRGERCRDGLGPGRVLREGVGPSAERSMLGLGRGGFRDELQGPPQALAGRVASQVAKPGLTSSPLRERSH